MTENGGDSAPVRGAGRVLGFERAGTALGWTSLGAMATGVVVAFGAVAIGGTGGPVARREAGQDRAFVHRRA